MVDNLRTNDNQLLRNLLRELRIAGGHLWVEHGKLRSKAPKGAITPALRTQIRSHKDALISFLQQTEQSDLPRDIVPALRPSKIPLSFAQQRLWFLSQLGSNIAYNMPIALDLRGPLNVTVLQQTLQEIVRRHESLRTTFAVDDGTPYQLIHPEMTIDLPVIDLRAYAPDEIEVKVKRLTHDEATHPFDLSCDPMLRATLLQLSDTRHHILLLTMHHIASDGWSMGVLVREMATLYGAFSQGQPSPLSDLPIQYADFAVWQRDYLGGEVLEKQLRYWTEQLADAPELLQLPTDRPRPAQQSFRGDVVSLKLDAHLTDALRTLSQQQGTTLYMTLLAAFQILMSRLNGQTDLLIGSPIANRNHREIEPLIGVFVNTLALRADLAGNSSETDKQPLSFLDVLAQARKTTQAAYDHQDIPFERLVEELRPERNLNYNPLVQVMFALQNAPMGAFELSGLNVSLPELEVQTTRFDLEMHFWEVDDYLQGHCIYSTDLFDKTTIERMAGHFQTLLQGIVDNPAQPIAKLPLLTEQERHQLLIEWNDTATDYPKDKCIHQLFEEWVERTPETIAVIFGEQQLTYQELNQRANQLAHYLQSLDVGPETLVGICIERSIEMVVGLLGILKAGGAYVPLDPAYPQERLAFMLSESNISLLLTQEKWLANLPEGTKTLCLDRLNLQAEPYNSMLSQNLTAQNLAYVMYTSGSTGRPKGVSVMHQNVVRLVKETNFIQFSTDDVFLQLAPISFDAATLEIWGPLLNGGQLVIMPPSNPSLDQLARAIGEHKVTTLWLSAGLFHLMVDEQLESLNSLRWLLAGGDVLSVRHVHKAVQALPNCQLINGYGPTENTTFTCCYPIKKVSPSERSIPIGRPIANTQVYILDNQRQLVPVGVFGELYAGGDGVARGYHNNEFLTQERFIANPFAVPHGSGYQERLYRTGDVARWLEGGEIEFLGRMDTQVKLRGFRIELGEIETVLTEHPAIREAIVLAREDQPGNKQLVGYLVANLAQESETEQFNRTLIPQVRSWLQAKLPDYMVPSAFVLLDALPLTSNGKVDRKALPAPTGQAQVESAYVMPQSELEQALVTIWQEELNLERVGIHDNFFDLGGHSLLLVRMHSRLQKMLDQEIKVVDLFTYPTVHALSQYLHPSTDSSEQTETTPVLAQSQNVSATSTSSVQSIAVIGMAGRFPGATSVNEFWQRLCQGEELISFFSAEELQAAGISAALQNNPRYVAAGGQLSDFDRFDAAFFGITPHEAKALDPQHRLFLESVWTALEDANCDPKRYQGAIGLYAGAGMNVYNHKYNLEEMADSEAMASAFQAMISAGQEFLATRTSYKLNLRGPSVVVQSACSTSLVAVHLACQSLRNGECDVALAGGVSVNLFEKRGYFYQEGMILSPDGHCRAFDAQAQGTVGSNGVGVVVLKPLEKALADGDLIHAVIKGTAINNDGSDKVGYTAPSVRGQAAVIAQAQANAGIEPDTISYIETHGTGTPLGDPIEIAALKQVFTKNPNRQTTLRQAQGPRCALGAVKSNIGHLGEAAGVAGLIKAVLALKHKQLPPTLHFTTPNPELGLEESPFYVNTELTAWDAPRGEHPRRAGVSSFGIGGTNAHVVLEEAPEYSVPRRFGYEKATIELGEVEDKSVTNEPSHHLLTLSAKSEAALTALVTRYVDFLNANPAATLADICYTGQVGRAHFEHRLGITGGTKSDLLEKLTTLQDQQSSRGTACPAVSGIARGQTSKTSNPRIAFLFTGQGSQYVNMGRDLYETQPTFRATLDRCDELLQQHLGESLLTILYPERSDQADNRQSNLIHQTTYTQPALFAFEYALAQLWLSWGIQPDVLIGHSIGELVAACIAGVFSLEDGLKLVAARGRLMGELPADGAMVAALATEATVQAALEPIRQAQGEPYATDVTIATINGPQNVVFSGQRDAVQAVATHLKAEGIRTRPLKVSHAFHSPSMEPMLDDLAKVARTITYDTPRIPIISNVTGELSTSNQKSLSNWRYWVDHVRQPVRFVDGVATLLDQDCDVLLEIGPKPTLVGMVRQNLDRATTKQSDKVNRNQQSNSPIQPVLLPSLRKGSHDWGQILRSLGELYVQGVTIEWANPSTGSGWNLAQGNELRKVTLPTYPFQRQRYWREFAVSNHNDTKEQPSLKELLADTDIDQLTQLLVETGKLPKVMERLVAGYDHRVADHQERVTPLRQAQGIPNGHVAAMPMGKEVVQPQDIRQQLVSADVTTQQNLLASWFQATVAQMLGYTKEEVNPQLGPGHLGMDSLLVIELRHRIEEAVGLDIPTPLLLTASFTQLADYAAEQLGTSTTSDEHVSTPQLATIKHPWVRIFSPRPDARLRLFTLPYAGGGASLYRSWAKALPAEIELCALQLPGREDRLEEPFLDDYNRLLNILVDALTPYLDKPLAFYGHSMGGRLVYELAQALRRVHDVEPVHLLIGAASGPQFKASSRYDSRSELFAALEAQRDGATIVQSDAELAALSRQIFKADIDLSKTRRRQTYTPLNCPITVFGGLDDPICTPEGLAAWEKQTTGPFALHLLPGNHFFLHSSRTALLRLIGEAL